MSPTHRSPNQDTSRRNLTGPLRKARAASRARLRPRQLRCEPLEDRRLLSVFTYSSNTAKTIPDKGSLTSTISVADAYYATDVNVILNISHTRDEDLDVFLIAPDGTRVELFTDVGGTGDHFTGTTLDDSAVTAITAGSAPFFGTYRPEGDLKTVERKSVNGTWKLEVRDDTRKETGKLNSWSLTVTDAAGISTDYLDTDPTMLGNVSRTASGGNGVAMAENGDAMAVWIESQGPGDTGPFMTMAAQYNAVAGVWSSPVMISDPTLTETVTLNFVANCHMSGDGQGNYLAVWEQATAGEGSLGLGSIWANRYVAEVGWQGPETIEDEVSPAWAASPHVAMAYDPTTSASKAVVAWTYGSATNGPSDVKVNRLTDFAGNTWSGASLAENLSATISAASLRVGMAANGDFLLTFKGQSSPADAYYRHYRWDSGWTSTESVLLESRAEDVTYAADLAMNAAGEAIVSWTQGTWGGPVQLWARRWTGSEWAGDAELLSDDPNNNVSSIYSAIKVAISDNGEATVLYPQRKESMLYRDVYAYGYFDEQWQGGVKLDSGDLARDGVNSASGIAMDDVGNCLALWRPSDGDFQNLWSAKFDRSRSTWSPAVKLENAPYGVSTVAVAMNSSGVATTLWVQPDNTLYHLFASRDTVAPASVQLSTFPQSSPLSALQSSADDATYAAQVDAVYQGLAYDALPQSTTTEKKSMLKPKKVLATEALDAVLAANDPWAIF